MSSRQKYVDIFNSLDKDGSGYLDQKELQVLLAKLGASEKAMFAAMDADGDNKITLKEFLVTLGVDCTAEDLREWNMRSVFRSFDKDGNGVIDRGEIDAVFQEVGKRMSEQDLKRCIELMDRDGDGQINYEEFIKYYFKK